MKKLVILLCLSSLVFTSQAEKKIIHTNKRHVTILVDGHASDWTISPEEKPDRFRVYCDKDEKTVVFLTDIDTGTFIIRKNDTIRFNLVLRSKDTAVTELIGIRDLPRQLTQADKLFWLGELWSEIKYNFVNIDRCGFNPDSLYRKYIPLVLESPDDYEYYRCLQKFAASFHDGHTEVSAHFSQYKDYVPVVFTDFGKKVYITQVRKIPGQDSTWVGAELTEIGNQPTAKYLETEVFPYVSASTEQSLWMQGVFKLHSDLRARTFTGTIREPDGSELKISLQYNGEATRTPKDQYWGPAPKYSGNIIDLSWVGDSIALIRYNRFQPEDEAIMEFNKAAKAIRGAKGLIIDLRSNGGGSTHVAENLQKYFTPGKYFLCFGAETRINDGYGKSQGNYRDEYKNFFLNKAYRYSPADTVVVSDTVRRIVCPTVILIGRYTFSAAEDFLVNLYEVPGRPKLIGSETGGSSGAPLVITDMPDEGYARICTLRICFPLSKTPFVNRGIKPDIELQPTIEDYLSGRDVVMERAVKELKGVMKK